MGIIWKVCYDKIISKLTDVTRLEHFEISKAVWFLMSLFPFNFMFVFSRWIERRLRLLSRESVVIFVLACLYRAHNTRQLNALAFTIFS